MQFVFGKIEEVVGKVELIQVSARKRIREERKGKSINRPKVGYGIKDFINSYSRYVGLYFLL